MIDISIEAILVENKSSYKDDKYIWAYNILLHNQYNEEIILLFLNWIMIYEHGFISKIENTYTQNIKIKSSSVKSLTNVLLMKNNLYGVLSGNGQYKIQNEKFDIKYNYYLSVNS